MNEPLVSISIITYNHKHFLGEAIDSVLMQEVDFPYEIIIGDDCSDDGTQEIIRDYEARYPEMIFGIYHPRRYDEIPGRTNNMTNLYACRGKYIAMLDGDDKWLSKDKLQKQYNFLERKSDYALCFHDALVVGEKNRAPYLRSERTFPFLKEKADYTHEDVAWDWFMPTSSLVFRNVFSSTELPNWFPTVIRADYALLLLITQFGKARYFGELKCMRRMNDGSFTKTYMQDLKVTLQLVSELDLYAEHFKAVQDHEKFKFNKYWYLNQYVRMADKLGDRKAMIDGIRRMYHHSPLAMAKFLTRFSYLKSRKILGSLLKH